MSDFPEETSVAVGERILIEVYGVPRWADVVAVERGEGWTKVQIHLGVVDDAVVDWGMRS
jgi:hypothetical protein